MIANMKPLHLAEVKELVGNLDDKKGFSDYLKKFSKLSMEKAEALKAELEALNNPKFEEKYIVKIIDFLPKDTGDVNKIFSDISLDEKETNEILEIVKKY